jgi:AAA+ superfamily predicted ATPase
MAMRLQDGDSVILDDDRDRVGIVVRREGNNLLKVQFPEGRETVPRNRVDAVAQKMAEAVARGARYSNTFSFKNRSNLGDLADRFGYTAEQRLHGNTLTKIKNQLARAGLELISEADRADSYFELRLLAETPDASTTDPERPGTEAGFSLPSPFWPEALGLAQTELLRFLRALPESDPVLCILCMPERKISWLQATWEGMLAWAYAGAQRFMNRGDQSADSSGVIRLPQTSLDRYSKGGSLPDDNELREGPGNLNLVAVESGSDEHNFVRIKALWPGPVFEFRPTFEDSDGAEALSALLEFLHAVGGAPGRLEKTDIAKLSPLNLLVWARTSASALLAASAIDFGELIMSQKPRRFRGSNEGSTALALKALVASSRRSGLRSGALSFEDQQDAVGEDAPKAGGARRVDLSIGTGVFEIETLRGSGPIEDFYHRKVFSRLDLAAGRRFHLVVPNDALVWAGPYLADIAHLLNDRGQVLVPAFEATKDADTELRLARLLPAPLERTSISVEDPRIAISGPSRRDDEERKITLADIAGYDEIRNLVHDEVIWTRRHPVLSKAASRAAGILFYGPPGCGKSRLARAISGELGHEVRLRGPADFKGLYIGWGQHLVREEFKWLFEDENRVLVIDEFDAIARSRREQQMHSDEKADVNELLVQLDRASRLRRLVLCTTNFVSSLDEAVVRSGRFSMFVPVGPPDVAAAHAIVNYYLRILGRTADGKPIENLDITLPAESDVRDIVAEACRNQAKNTPWLAGADFEQAVNRAWNLAARSADQQMTTGVESPQRLRIALTADLIRVALRHTRRSVSWDTMQAFLEEIRAHSPLAAEDLSSRFLGERE